MIRSCIHKRHKRTVTVFMAVMALLFAQTLPLHAHNAADHHQPLQQMGIPEHHSEIHVATSDVNDKSHSTLSEIDLSAEAVVKRLTFNDSLLATLTFFAILFIPLLISTARWSATLQRPFTTRGIAFRPPLRAPPL